MKKIIIIVLAVLAVAAGIIYYMVDTGSYVAKVGGQRIKNYEYVFFSSYTEDGNRI